MGVVRPICANRLDVHPEVRTVVLSGQPTIVFKMATRRGRGIEFKSLLDDAKKAHFPTKRDRQR